MDTGSVVVNGPAALPQRVVHSAIQHVLRKEERNADISVTFLGLSAMKNLNSEFKGHDRVTDVIAFSLPQPDGSLAGDIYLCRYQAARQARDAGHSVRSELLRLLVHGTLHLLDWDHPEDEGREQSPMWLRQEQLLEQLS